LSPKPHNFAKFSPVPGAQHGVFTLGKGAGGMGENVKPPFIGVLPAIF